VTQLIHYKQAPALHRAVTSRAYWQRWREERRREKTRAKYVVLEAQGQGDLFSEEPMPQPPADFVSGNQDSRGERHGG
jgi:hypothetical protein